jgi:hypothetical protein
VRELWQAAYVTRGRVLNNNQYPRCYLAQSYIYIRSHIYIYIYIYIYKAAFNVPMRKLHFWKDPLGGKWLKPKPITKSGFLAAQTKFELYIFQHDL